MKGRIFISHHSSTRSDAEELCTLLEARGHRCWLAPRDIRPGRDWAGAILEGIDRSPVMLVLESAEAACSGHVDREVSYAVSAGKRLLRVRLPGVPADGAPLSLYIPPDAPVIACPERVADALPEILALLARGRSPIRRGLLPVAGCLAAAGLCWLVLSLREERSSSAWPEQIEFVTIPPGSFVMGSPDDEEYRWQAEGPRVRVRVEGFELMSTEVTQEMWSSVMGSTQRDLVRLAGQEEVVAFLPPAEGPDLPVVMVTWDEAVAFAESLSLLDPLHVYRLPTEAEWEYACRAGCVGAVPEGEDGPGATDGLSWHFANSGGSAHPVAGLAPNRWGLYDMLGNAAEWCLDGWRPDHAGSPALASDTVPGVAGFRVRRGSSFVSSPRLHRCAFRDMAREIMRHQTLGFRILRVPR